MNSKRSAVFLGLGVGLAFVGCKGNNVGNAQVFMTAEDTVNGIDGSAGAVDGVIDGWNVTYDKWIVNVGDVHASSSADATAVVEDPTFTVIDLKNGLPAAGIDFADFNDIPAVRYDKF